MSTSNVVAPPDTSNRQVAREARRARRSNRQQESRWAFYLIVPTIVLLAIVIGYPVVSAIIMSFQKDAGLDPATGLFVQGGFAGFQNYAHWLFQQCAGPNGDDDHLPAGQPRLAVLERRLRHLLLHGDDRHPRDHARHVVRAHHEPHLPRPRPRPRRHPGAVGHPHRRHREALVLHLLGRRRRQRRARRAHPLDQRRVGLPLRGHHRRHLEDHAVHGAAASSPACRSSPRRSTRPRRSTARRPGSGSGG